MKSFGKYQIVEKVGEGGFGTLYRGFDPLIQRTVAVKTCTSDDPEVRDRFFREAKIAGNLQHRNITIVHDFGIEAGVPYLVQEYLLGEDLHRKIEGSEKLPFGTKLLYLIQIARGLQHAHQQGVVHRDIKPSNIRVLPDGTVKIMDFGIAKVQSLHNSLTQTGETIGTAAYLSPEQIRGEEVDARADIFSFGVLAYELLTGERAFAGETPSTVLYAVLSRIPRPIQELWPSCPDQVQAVVDRCLEKDRDDRYSNCAELLAALSSLLDGKEEAPSRTSSSGVIAPPSGRIRSDMAQRELSSADTVAIPRSSLTSVRVRGNDTEYFDAIGADSIRDGSESADLDQPIVENKVGPLNAHRNTHNHTPPRSAIGLLMLLLVISGLGTGVWWYGKGFRAIWAKAPDRLASQQSQSPALAEMDFETTNELASTIEETDPTGSEHVDAALEAPDEAVSSAAEEASQEATSVPQVAPPDNASPAPTGGTTAAVAQSGAATPTIAAAPSERSSLAESLLTVRQLPGTERCYIRLGGSEIGWTPRQKLALPPGSYQLEVYLSEEATIPILSQPLILNRGMARIVTVDIGRGLVHSYERALSDEVPPSDRP
jgi:serine/threonine-protein kinase